MNKQEDTMFPEVAILRKGKPKKKITKTVKGEKKTYEVMGEDLGQKMRVHFNPGADVAKAAFHQTHAKDFVEYPEQYVIRNGYEVLSLRAVVPVFNAFKAWSYANEVYQAGRRLGMADDDHYIYLRDPLDGNKYLVKDGEPYRKYEPKELIHYERDGRTYDLQVKAHGRLYLVLEDLVNAGQLVQVVLKTTSWYDCQNIKKQLAGIQAVADLVSNGNAGGVPFNIYRTEQEVTWNKPDGGAMRVKKWFYNLQADPDWVKKAFARMSRNALTGETLAKALLPETTFSGPVNPNSEVLDEEGDNPPTEFGEEDGVYNATAVEINSAPTAPSPAPQLQGELDGQTQPAPVIPPASKPTPPPAGGTAYKFNDNRIVVIFVKEWNLPTDQVIKTLYEQNKAGKIPETLTEAQARAIATGQATLI